jgi:hypothetical protein
MYHRGAGDSRSYFPHRVRLLRFIRAIRGLTLDQLPEMDSLTRVCFDRLQVAYHGLIGPDVAECDDITRVEIVAVRQGQLSQRGFPWQSKDEEISRLNYFSSG